MPTSLARALTILAVCLTGFLLQADDPAAKDANDLGRLQKSYEQKRADTLKSVMAGYATQLETLQKKLTQKGDLDGAVSVRKELDAVKERASFVGLGPARNAKEPDELTRLRKIHQQKRIDALKPVMNGYENQLETLRKKLTLKNDLDGALLVRNELDALRESLTMELSWELTRALLSTTWSWSDKPNDRGVEMTFTDDGIVSHIGMRGTWQAVGPREITIQEIGGAKSKFLMRFDPKITAYEQVGGPLHGRRWQ